MALSPRPNLKRSLRAVLRHGPRAPAQLATPSWTTGSTSSLLLKQPRSLRRTEYRGSSHALAPGGNPGFEGAKGREIGRMPQRHQASALGRQPEKAEEAAFPAVGLGSKS
mmetsp:Transcript_40005/g.62436  ORF Transcript_40005/g.62436 Transcript_40005/m.62436 type:complete len:110 (-) Transcript_40005:144-473(-)